MQIRPGTFCIATADAGDAVMDGMKAPGKIHVPETAFHFFAMQLVYVEVHLKHSWKNICVYIYICTITTVRIIHILYICINNYDQLIIIYIIYMYIYNLQTCMEANICSTRGVRTLTENIPFFSFLVRPPDPTSQKGLCTCSMWSKTIYRRRRKYVKICKQH